MSKAVRVITGMLLVALAAGLLAAAQVKNPDTFTFYWVDDIRSLDPAFISTTPDTYASLNLYEGLVHFKGASLTEYVPVLATEVPSLDNGLLTKGSDGTVHYVFPIRKGVFFHKVGVKQDDGTIVWKPYDELTSEEKAKIVPGYGELTPEDVKYSLLRAMLLGVSWMSDAFVYPFSGGEYRTAERMAMAMAGVDSFDKVPASTLVEVYNTLAARIKVTDDAVEMILPKPFPPFLGMLSLGFGNLIVDKEWVIAQGGWPGTAETWKDYHRPTLQEDPLFDKENGTGPFQLEEWDKATNTLILKRFDGYWRAPAKLRRVIIKSVPEWSTRLMAIKAGDADMIAAPFQYLDQVEGLPGVTVKKGLTLPVIWAAFFAFSIDPEAPGIGSGKLDGNGVPPDFFNDVNVRKGFCYAFDYETYFKDVLMGYAPQAHGPIPSGILGWREDQPVYKQDLDKAREYFKKAYGGKLWETGFKVTAYYMGTGENTVISMLQQALLQINPKFKLEAQGLQWSTFIDWMFAPVPKMPLFICNWGPDYPDPGGPLGAATYFLSPDNVVAQTCGENYRRLMQEKYVPLLKKGMETIDPVEREKIYNEIQQMAYWEDALQIYLEEMTGTAVYRSWVKGIVFNKMLCNALEFYTIEKAGS